MAESQVIVERCSCCETEIRRNTASIACSMCLSWFHKGCTGISIKNFNSYQTEWRKSHKHTWVCESCEVSKAALGAPRRSGNFSTVAVGAGGDVANLSSANNKRNQSDRQANPDARDNSEHRLGIDLSTLPNKGHLTIKDAISAICQLHKLLVEQGNAITNLVDEIKALRIDNERMKSMETDIQILRDELVTVRSNAASTDERSPRDDIEALRQEFINDSVRELNDRQQRQKNIMIFGVGEAVATDAQTKRELDINAATDVILQACPGASLEDIRVFRVGREDSAKNRPIKVILKSTGDAKTILQHAKELKQRDAYKNITIRHDNTPKQMMEYRAVKSSLVTRLENGETDLRIKYFNGVPKIIKTKPSDLNH